MASMSARWYLSIRLLKRTGFKSFRLAIVCGQQDQRSANCRRVSKRGDVASKVSDRGCGEEVIRAAAVPMAAG